MESSFSPGSGESEENDDEERKEEEGEENSDEDIRKCNHPRFPEKNLCVLIGRNNSGELQWRMEDHSMPRGFLIWSGNDGNERHVQLELNENMDFIQAVTLTEDQPRIVWIKRLPLVLRKYSSRSTFQTLMLETVSEWMNGRFVHNLENYLSLVFPIYRNKSPNPAPTESPDPPCNIWESPNSPCDIWESPNPPRNIHPSPSLKFKFWRRSERAESNEESSDSSSESSESSEEELLESKPLSDSSTREETESKKDSNTGSLMSEGESSNIAPPSEGESNHPPSHSDPPASDQESPDPQLDCESSDLSEDGETMKSIKSIKVCDTGSQLKHRLSECESSDSSSGPSSKKIIKKDE